MVRRMRGVFGLTLAVVLVGSAGSAVAAPEAKLKQFRVPTANSQPREITTGSDGSQWFIEGTEFTGAPAKIARITPSGVVTEFSPGAADGCNDCILTDIAQGPGGVLYVASNDPALIRFDVTTAAFGSPVPMPDTSALGGHLATSGADVWVTDFNNDVVWRYDIALDQFTSFTASDPSDVAVDAAGNAWFSEPDTNSLGRIDAVTGAVTRTPTTDGSTTVAPRAVAVATEGQIWFTARFTPQAVGRLDPTTGSVALFPRDNVGPAGIAASPDGTVWFTQETKGNLANITNAGVVTEAKVVKGSGPAGITVDRNGRPWYTMRSADKIGTLQ